MTIRKVSDMGLKKSIAKLKSKKTTLPRQLGQVATRHFVQGFRTGGGQTDAGRWKPRTIWDKAQAAGSVGRGILIGRTGDLKKSIRNTSASWSRVIIESVGIKYADIHNFGGTIRQTVTKKQRGFFMGKYKSTGVGMYLAAARSKTLTINIPKREFIGKSKKLDRKIIAKINRELKKIFK